MPLPKTPGDQREDHAAAAGAAVAAIYEQAELVMIAAIAALARKIAAGTMTQTVAVRQLRRTVHAVLSAAAPQIRKTLDDAMTGASQQARTMVTSTSPFPGPGPDLGQWGRPLAELLDQAGDTAAQAAEDEFASVAKAIANAVPAPALPGTPPILPGNPYHAAIDKVLGDRGWPGSTLSARRIQAAQEILDDLAEHGITGFTDKAGRKWDLATYVEMATRTAVSNAWDDMQAQAAIRTGLDLVKTGTYSQEGSCPLCVVPGTLIEGPAPKSRIRLEYRGDVISIATASGKHLTGTPDHSVLTPQGWRRLKELRPGDEIISDSGQQLGRAASLAPDVVVPDHIDMPTLVEKVGEAVAPLLLSGPARRHLDVDVAYREVQVVWPDSLLLDELDAAFPQPFGDGGFVGGIGTAAPFFAACDMHPVLEGLPLAAIGRVGGAHDGLALVGGGVGPAAAHPLGMLGALGLHNVGWRGGLVGDDAFPLWPQLDARTVQVSLDGAMSDAVGLREIPAGLASLVPADEFSGRALIQLAMADAAAHGLDTMVRQDAYDPGLADVESGLELLNRLAALVAPDEIVGVSVRQYNGHVWDLHTAPNWYSSNGVISHNCIPWLGKTLSLTGATDGYPTVDEAKAAGWRHPSCRCFWVPIGASVATDVTNPVDLDDAAQVYKASQHQRALERHVRAAGRRAQSAITPQAKTRARRDLAAARAASAAHRQRHQLRMMKVTVQRRERPWGAR